MNDLKVSDIMCKWYIWVAVGYVIGKNLSDTLGGLIGLAIGGLIGCYIQKNHSKKGSITNFVGFPIPLVALSAHIE
jgi:hypothetical protein